MYQFKEAKAIWLSAPREQWNQFAGFYTKLLIPENTRVTIALAARSYYRLFINGEFAAAGPARSAEHYCRVDEHSFVLSGKCHIAVEVVAYSKPNRYCNDCTLEPGLFIMEIRNEEGHVLSATGRDDITCKELEYRRSKVETMSHCRGIVEYYDLTEKSFAWRTGETSEKPVLTDAQVTYQKRDAPYAVYQVNPFSSFLSVSDVAWEEQPITNQHFYLSRIVNPTWYAEIPLDNLFLKDLLCETERPFSGTLEYVQGESGTLLVQPGERPSALTWELPEAEVGFLDLCVTVENACTLDLMNATETDARGEICANTYAARFCLSPGVYHLTTFEPKLVKYAKAILRTTGKVKLCRPQLLDYSYPDNRLPYFRCNDGELNRIYEAARRTLRLNMLDIFMDCPERERGGWLCDSFFSARGAWAMFGDLSVERDFMENFMLTDAQSRWHAFFPEVYPAARGNGYDVGIRSWSIWLLLELCDYYERSGDRDFIEQCRARVEAFIEGLLSLRGESGLLENMGTLFVDWSQSNLSFALDPISVPVNCLAACMLEQTAKLYEREDWAVAADEISSVLNELESNGLFSKDGDAAVFFKDDTSGKTTLERNGLRTESGIALELWSGFHSDNDALKKRFREEMGSVPHGIRMSKQIMNRSLSGGKNLLY